MEKEQRIEVILEVKEIMKKLATINDKVNPNNRGFINGCNDDLKTLCELLDY